MMTKQQMYDLGWYEFPVCETAARCRTDEQWINFIDDCGRWLPEGGKKPYFMPAWLRKMGVSLADDGVHYDAGSTWPDD